MDYERILGKKNKLMQNKSKIDSITFSSYEKDFELNFIYNSAALSGNSLSFDEIESILNTSTLIKSKKIMIEFSA